MNKLMTYQWPGNVRELQHCLERAVILSESNVLQPDDFFLTPSQADAAAIVFENYNLELVEKIVIRKALEKYRGNVTQASLELGLTRASLYRRMEKYGI
jgi:transcriptional regulator of acetoin/glycerol metabolism